MQRCLMIAFQACMRSCPHSRGSPCTCIALQLVPWCTRDVHGSPVRPEACAHACMSFVNIPAALCGPALVWLLLSACWHCNCSLGQPGRLCCVCLVDECVGLGHAHCVTRIAAPPPHPSPPLRCLAAHVALRAASWSSPSAHAARPGEERRHVW